MPANLEFEQFRAWLQAFSPNAVVGYGTAPCDCPIARYLSRQPGNGPISVSTDEFWDVAHDTEAIPLPEWAKNFVFWADRTRGAITAKAALELLAALARAPVIRITPTLPLGGGGGEQANDRR